MNLMNESIEVFPWNDNFSTGIPLIDEQHKRLIHLINLLACGLAYQSDTAELDRIFSELADYAAYHFKTEEAVWHNHLAGDEWEEEHKNSHNRFVADLIELKSKKDHVSVNETLKDVLSFLTHWLAFHILESDKHMSKVALGLQSGMTLTEAKLQAAADMSGSMKVLIETVLSMYDTLSSRTLELIKEVIDRQKAEAKLRLAANAIENTLEAICITDQCANIIDANPAFQQITQQSLNALIGKNLRELKSGLNNEPLFTGIIATLAEEGHWSGEVKSRSQAGETYTDWLTLSSIKDEYGAISNYVGIFSNFSRLSGQWHELQHMANHDALTGLPNRLLLADRMELAMAHAERTGSFLAICYLDLDNFKPVNDTLGHTAGDLVLREVSKRLQSHLRLNDTVSRVGGDEFVILLNDLHKPDDFEELLVRILSEICLPIGIREQHVFVTGSIGVTQFPHDRGEADMLLAHADSAMYQAKNLGKSRYQLYQIAKAN
ncbi:MAG TPA: diguanylate cyclase [Gallionella sp.]|nr:bacteriohemerythrin [Gallionella sp.]OGS67950.1 MAG: diguanylate cyclase [Gallionellales bacterium GWA2_54_124]OGT19391.1 MAG: diguanylate cyclase [Gallionellales bacterium RIFOXYD12_FULL_53_10]HCI53028.1 diguanylate cyclase [Gallionella sp.]